MMRSQKNFLIEHTRSVKQAMRQLSEIGEKELFVIDAGKKLMGALSDGDIRKWILREGSLEVPVEQVCNKSPKYFAEDYDLEAVKKLMLELKIECVPVVDGQGFVSQVLTWDDVFAGNVTRQREVLSVPVVIMAGGKGTRLDPFTRILPKPLIPIGDTPVIELIMEKFAAYSIQNFYISINHKARMIKSYFEEMGDKYILSYIEESKPLGTAGSLKMIQGRVQGPVVVTNCDVIIDCDYSQLMDFHQEHKNDLTMVVSCRHYVIPYGVCEIAQGGILKTIKEKPEQDMLINTGMYVMEAKLLDLIPKNEFYNFTDLIIAAQAKGLRIGVFPIPEKAWLDVGQWEEYQKAAGNFNHYGS